MKKKILFFLMTIVLIVSSCNFGMNTAVIGNKDNGAVLNGYTGGLGNSSSVELPNGANYKPDDKDIVDGYFIVKTKDGFDKTLFEKKVLLLKERFPLQIRVLLTGILIRKEIIKRIYCVRLR